MCIWVYGRWGEEGGASAPPPPSPFFPKPVFNLFFSKFCTFANKTLMIQAKYSGEHILKGNQGQAMTFALPK